MSEPLQGHFFFAPKPLNALSPAPIPAMSQGFCWMGGSGGTPTVPNGDLEGPGSGAGRGQPVAAGSLPLAEAGWPVSHGHAQSPGALGVWVVSTVNKNFCDPA